MKIYLLRHGQTEYNEQKRYQGTRDIPLSEKGRACLRQADLEPAEVYVSPLSRAVETAQILFPKLCGDGTRCRLSRLGGRRLYGALPGW